MRDDYWLYDISTGEYDGKEVIWLWCLDEGGNVHILIDPVYKNYFYVSLESIEEDQLRRYLISEFGRRADEMVEEVTKNLLGSQKRFIKITCEENLVREVAQKLRRKLGEHALYEDDIRITIKYLIDKKLSPSSWYEIDVEPLYSHDGLQYCIVKEVKSELADKPAPSLKTISVELLAVSKLGTPDPQKDPIQYVVVYDGVDYKELTVERDDVNVLRDVSEYIRSVNPNVIVTFRGNTFIWPYLVERAKYRGVKLNIGLPDAEPHQSLYGHFSIAGRLNVDLKEYVDDIPALQRKTLEELADLLGLPEPEVYIDEFRLYDYWVKNKEVVKNYLKWRAKVLWNAYKILEDHILSLSNITGIPADFVLTASSGRQIEHYIMRKTREFNEVIPKVLERPFRTYPGGLVLEPKPGLHRDVAVIDYKSMYPTLILKHNISPETISTKAGVNVTYYEEAGVGVRNDIKGLFPTIVETLLKERDAIRVRMKNIPKESDEYRILDTRQKILKVLSNTVYGYMGWRDARWYCFEGASLVTFLGRNVIGKSLKKAEELGLKVIYGDTDSLFVHYDKDKVDKLITWISEELGLEAKVEKVYRTVLFTEAKKRYAGVTVDNKIDVVGLEYVRRDWCDYARETQYEFIKMVLSDHVDRNKIINEFRNRISKLRSRAVPVEKLIIWEQITRPLDEYKANAPHISVARKLVEAGWKITKGIFIGYVIHKGEGPLYKRAVHYTEADLKLIDVDYYIMNQVLPVVKRIVEPIGISEKTLLSVATTSWTGLDTFTKSK